MTDYVALMPRLFKKLDTPHLLDGWSGVDVLLPVLEKMRSEGAVVVLKLDGERTGDDAHPYSAVVSNNVVGDQYFHTDSTTIEGALSYVIVNYYCLKLALSIDEL